MKPISSEIVEKTWKKMARIPPQEAQKMITLIGKKQPIILAYLMACGSDIFNQDERELLLYLGVVVWQIMSQGSTSLPKIKENTVDKVENSNMKMIEYLKGESDTGFIDTVEKIINNYSQPEVLKYVIEALMEETEEGCLIRDENKGIMAIYLKTVIDCLNT
jgi:hypothetical protein